MTGIRRPTWVLALAAALLIHVGAAVVLVWQPPTLGAQSYGAAGVAVGLAAAGAPPGADAAGDPALAEAEAAAAESARTAEAETAQEVAAAETETVRSAEAEPVTMETAKDVVAKAVRPAAAAPVTAEAPVEAPPAEVQAREATAAAAETTPQQATQTETRLAEPLPPGAESLTASPSEPSLAAEPVTVDAAEAEVAEDELPVREATEAAVAAPPPPPVRPARTDPEPRSTRPEPPREDRAPPPPSPPALSAPERTVEPVEVPEGGTEIAAAPAATAPPGGGDAGRRAVPPGSGGRAGSKAESETGYGPGAEGGGSPGERADFLAQLQAWLERHKEYPRRAQRRRQEGTATLFFVMSRDGRVLDFRIEESSGHEALDREVRAMIERAQPLPAIPDSMRQSRLELVVPIVFSLR
ncbi:energy transducer TonB [Minwuia thermotolerans]|uniref:TonB C-terminal domain-containing protein n=1 Tax=Minwuia thermotolerans TaxID=2056226 RepID=A0A2M9FVD0_9PROT|nr:energy transducer TonB [Minwuia thermotolerans]PJK27432.1 hypothetical protein CVT23_21135 [Minwuia thermotolerans]